MNPNQSTIQGHDSSQPDLGHLVKLESRITPLKTSIPRRQQQKRHQQQTLQQRRQQQQQQHRPTQPYELKSKLIVSIDKQPVTRGTNINNSYSDQRTEVSSTELSARLEDIAPPSPPLEDDDPLSDSHDDRPDNQTRYKKPVDVVEKTSDANMDLLIRLINVIRKGTYEEFLRILSSKVMNKYLLNLFVDGQTALHYSLMRGRNLAWSKKLISLGSNPDLMNQDGWHPIHLAAYSGLHETMIYLIDLCDEISQRKV